MAQGVEFPAPNATEVEAIGGNWVEQEDLKDDMFVKAAVVGVERLNEKLERDFVLDQILAVRTQSAAGINFDITLKVVDGPQFKLRVWRSFNMVEYDLTDYAFVF